ncbi:MAG TPA: hypothetical protein VGZ91_07020 [Candidatus Sulfotelmatobacter sp.]|nr:hypothetical protein [Candidatus Sulfotelmatobacter sp.]
MALLFTAMLNVLRLRNGYAARGLKLFCIGANILMLTFVVALIMSIGKARVVQHPQIAVVGALVIVELMFSLGQNS